MGQCQELPDLSFKILLHSKHPYTDPTGKLPGSSGEVLVVHLCLVLTNVSGLLGMLNHHLAPGSERQHYGRERGLEWVFVEVSFASNNLCNFRMLVHFSEFHFRQSSSELNRPCYGQKSLVCSERSILPEFYLK